MIDSVDAFMLDLLSSSEAGLSVEGDTDRTDLTDETDLSLSRSLLRAQTACLYTRRASELMGTASGHSSAHGTLCAEERIRAIRIISTIRISFD
jgi:hypothetical protein